MKKRIAIFGPPGVGKSALIKTASKRGIKAYDFEEFSSEERGKCSKEIFEESESFDGIILFNAADLQPNDFPPDVKLVLLLPPKDVYLKRIKERDRINRVKAGQEGNKVYNGFSKHKRLFHKIIKEVEDPDEILNKIIKD